MFQRNKVINKLPKMQVFKYLSDFKDRIYIYIHTYIHTHNIITESLHKTQCIYLHYKIKLFHIKIHQEINNFLEKKDIFQESLNPLDTRELTAKFTSKICI